VKKPVFQPGHGNTVSSKIIGVPTPRSEGPDKVSGRAVYAADVVLPGMLWAKVLRSPISFGRVKKIDTSRAAVLPGVYAVATGEDVRGRLIGRKIYDMPILADGVVRFIGEKVVAVAAESEEIAEAALELIEVEYEELAPLLDPLAAVKRDASLLHPEVQHYRGLLHPIDAPTNVFVDMTWKKGDIEAGFAHSDIMVENAFTTQPVHQAYIEPHACVVEAHGSAGAELWACSKVPFALREQVAAAFDVGPEQFVLHPCYIGGCFGGKGAFMDVPVGYILSAKSGRPVKLVMDYYDEFVAGNPRHAAVIRVKTGVKKNGELVAQRLGMDPLSFRKMNLMRDGDESPIGHVVPHIKSEETMDDAIKASGYLKPKRKHLGRGLAVAQWLPLGGESHAFVGVDKRGRVTVSTAMVDQGAGTYTAMRQIVAHELRVPVESVGVEILDTNRVASDTGVGASRATRFSATRRTRRRWR